MSYIVISSLTLPLTLFISQGKKYVGVVDLVFFDGASNVQKAADIIALRYPRITSACAAEHTTSLLFDDVYNKVDEFKELGNFTKKLRNVFWKYQACYCVHVQEVF